MRNILSFSLLAIVLLLLSQSPALSAVALSVTERDGVDRVNEYVQSGIPLPKSWNITDVSGLLLSDGSGTQIPAQFVVLSRWGGAPSDNTKPIKWVLVGFFTTISNSSSQSFQLSTEGPGPPPTAGIQVDTATPGKLVVDTQAAQYEINTGDDFNLFHQVTVGGRSVLQPLSARQAIVYEASDGRSIVSGGTPDLTPRVTSAAIERSGSLCTVIKVSGSVLDSASQAVLDYTARLHFYAGSAEARVDFTVENNHPILEGEWGQPTNVHAQGGPNSVFIGSLKLALRPVASTLQVLTEQGVTVSSPASQLRLYQDSSGTSNWDAYVGLVGWEGVSCAPRLQSYCTQSGYTIAGPGVSLNGAQATGWMAAGEASGTFVTVGVQDFWQNFPKAIQTDTDGTLSVDLFPNGNTFNHNFRPGEEKTHTLMYQFDDDGTSAQVGQRLVAALTTPLFCSAPATWYIDSGALGEVPQADLNKWPAYERYTRTAFEPNPDFGPDDDPSFGNTTLNDAVERFNFYGWQDYGDVPLDYEAFGENQAGQMNLKYWYVHGMLTQFCRTADPRWMDLALPAARHLADVDYLHIPDEGIQHWAHGAYFGHSDHDEPGCTNPNRNYNSPSVDLFFGVPELIFAYHLTGEQRFMDTALEGLQAMENLSQFADSTYPVFYRERANLIFGYLEGFRQTGDTRWLNNLRTLIGQTADLTDKQGWLTSPTTYVPPAGGPMGDERTSGFQFVQTVWAMARYLDFSTEYSLADDLGVAQALTTYGDFILNHLVQEIPEAPGSYATIDSIWFTAPYETYLEVNNWALLMADTLAYAYKYSDRQQFLTMAAELYETGTENPVWLGSPPVYIASKDLANALSWGLVYMNQSSGGSTDWVRISGSVSYNDAPVCAMVLANGQYMFSCKEGEDFGKYELDVPLDSNGDITVQAFVSGLAPFRMTTTPSSSPFDIDMQLASPESQSATVTTVIESDESTTAGWARITGTVSLDGTPLCAMVLANGQYMFSCGTNNGVYDLTVPLDSIGEITLFVFVSGLRPYNRTFAP